MLKKEVATASAQTTTTGLKFPVIESLSEEPHLNLPTPLLQCGVNLWGHLNGGNLSSLTLRHHLYPTTAFIIRNSGALAVVVVEQLEEVDLVQVNYTPCGIGRKHI